MADLPTREPDGKFWSFETWVSKAASWIGGTNPLCADAQDRICRIGRDFMRARDEDAFPVRYWHGEGPLTPAEHRKSIYQARRAIKLQYPWRR
jgi:hypothetical protein